MSDKLPAELSAAFERYSEMVDDQLAAIIGAEEQVASLHDGMLYSMGLDIPDRAARGKRLRPVLCLLTAESLGAAAEEALAFACGIELMHNFALVHDDIEDGDEVRRDRPSTHLKYGLAHGVNIGDYLFCKVWSVLLDEPRWSDATRLELMRLMSSTLDHTHIGQSLDISARDRGENFRMEEYYRLVREKTAYYLAAPMVGGAIVAGADAEIRDALSRFGHALGPMFQITDDLLDLTKGKGRGGLLGSDIKEGKRSFLVADVASRADAADRTRLFEILDKSREDTTSDDVAWVIELFERCGTLDVARARCKELLEEGIAALESVPQPLRDQLTAVARQVSTRQR
ncbi:polyprenyl synthetase family protein [bacterium]|nr:polyprenyl synthetase family protein [bacterium]